MNNRQKIFVFYVVVAAMVTVVEAFRLNTPGQPWMDQNVSIGGVNGIVVTEPTLSNLTIGVGSYIQMAANASSENRISSGSTWMIFSGLGGYNNFWVSDDSGGGSFNKSGAYYVEYAYRADTGTVYSRVYSVNHSTVYSGFEYDPNVFELKVNSVVNLYSTGNLLSIKTEYVKVDSLAGIGSSYVCASSLGYLYPSMSPCR